MFSDLCDDVSEANLFFADRLRVGYVRQRIQAPDQLSSGKAELEIHALPVKIPNSPLTVSW